MHEMSITKSMLEIVEKEMNESGMKALRKLRVRVGELTAVEPESLKFCFDAAIKGTAMEGATLEVEDVPLKGRCLGCAAEFRITAFAYRCPVCGAAAVERVAGDELDIISMEGE
jgi:hydrogenase nickel incorporation protein HypA/HybF